MYLPGRNYYSQEYSNGLDEMDAFLTPQEVMELFSIGKNTLYKLLNSGEIKGFRLGRKWRISRESLRKL